MVSLSTIYLYDSVFYTISSKDTLTKNGQVLPVIGMLPQEDKNI